MPSQIAGFFKGWDLLGSPVQINYKQSTEYGTVFGGACSLLTEIFFYSFTGLMLFAFFFDPNYNKQVTTSYLAIDETELYEIPKEYYLPAFAIVGNKTAFIGGSTDLTEYDMNNMTNFEILFIQESTDGVTKSAPSFPCGVAIQAEVNLSQEQKDAVIAELDERIDYLCPYTIEGFQLQGSVATGEERVRVLVTPTAEGEANGAAD